VLYQELISPENNSKIKEIKYDIEQYLTEEEKEIAILEIKKYIELANNDIKLIQSEFSQNSEMQEIEFLNVNIILTI
jgi:hypothetical protein